MVSLPRTECPEPGCGRDVAVSNKGLASRHDPPGGRTPELKSCPGSLKPVAPPAGDPVLFISPDGDTAAAEDTVMPEPVRLF